MSNLIVLCLRIIALCDTMKEMSFGGAAMFLKKATRTKTNRTYLSIVEGYWDAKTKTSRTKTVQKVGYLDELINEFPDPVAHFEDVAKQMTLQKKASQISLTFDPNEELKTGEMPRSVGFENIP